MQKYDVIIFPIAQQDLQEIFDYIATASPQEAIKQYDRIVDKISSLETMPFRAPMPKDSQLMLKGYRMIIIDEYLVFFIIVDNTVQIRRIIHSKRRYEWLI